MIIETTIEVFNRQLSDLAGIEELMSVKMSFRLDDVIAVRETIDDGDTEVNPEKCVIYLKSGESFIIFYSYENMIKALNYKSEKNYPL